MSWAVHTAPLSAQCIGPWFHPCALIKADASVDDEPVILYATFCNLLKSHRSPFGKVGINIFFFLLAKMF